MDTSFKNLRGAGIYLNLFTDHGFKIIFGEEENKPFLIQLLNALLKEEVEIIDLRFLPNEQLGLGSESRGAIYDLYCETLSGEKIIVELQQAKHKNFKDRLIYYSTWPIQSQGKSGSEWGYRIDTVYTIGILNFIEHDDPYLLHKAELIDRQTGRKWSKALCYITLETPKIPLRADDCQLEIEYWAWIFKNSYLLKNEDIPFPSNFKKFLKKCKLKNINKFDENSYRKSLMDLQELEAIKEYAYEEAIEKVYKKAQADGLAQGLSQGLSQGKAEGLVEGQREIIKKMKLAGLSEEEIQRIVSMK